MNIGYKKENHTMPCPKCAIDPLTTTSIESDQVADLSALVGRECTQCAYVVVDADIDVAMIAILERLLLKRGETGKC
jgi:hypothetical protein